MDTAALLAFNIALLGALASPGPAFLSIVQSSMTGGRARGIACALGLSVGAVAWSLLAVLGLTAVFAVVPWAYLALKVLGAGYLIWIAVGLWRHADRPVDAVETRGRSGFRLGLLVNLANPKAVFFIAAIYATVFPVMPQGWDAALILGNHFLVEVIYYGGCAIALSTAPVRRAYARAKAWLDRTAAAILGLMAARIVT